MNCRTHEHRHFERTLRSTDPIPGPRLDEGRSTNKTRLLCSRSHFVVRTRKKSVSLNVRRARARRRSKRKRDLSMKNDDLENLNISFFIIYLCVCVCVVISKAYFIERDSRITVHRAQKVESRSSIFVFSKTSGPTYESRSLYTRERAHAHSGKVKYFFSKA